MVDNELNFYEKLNEATSIRGFITASVNIFDDAVDRLMNRVFRKADFAVQSVVNSLFEQSGPLFELAIRLKVLLGLGVISHEIFEDINRFIAIKERLNNDGREYDFSDQMIVEFVQSLHFQTEQIPVIAANPLENKDSLAFQMKMMRQEKLIRSSLTLVISEICECLQIESPL